jgi:hypothetical protein
MEEDVADTTLLCLFPHSLQAWGATAMLRDLGTLRAAGRCRLCAGPGYDLGDCLVSFAWWCEQMRASGAMEYRGAEEVLALVLGKGSARYNAAMSALVRLVAVRGTSPARQTGVGVAGRAPEEGNER